jgi:protein TonB
MFEQSLIDSTGKRSGALAISATAQTVLVGIMILIPLIYSDRLPIAMPTMPLTLPLSLPDPIVPEQPASSTPTSRPSLLPIKMFRPPVRSGSSSAAPAITTQFDGPPGSSDFPGISNALPFPAGTELPHIIVSPPAAPPVVVPKPPEHPHAVGGDVQAAKLIRKVTPVYPPIAIQAHVSGTVHLVGIIATDGSIRQLQVIGGNPLLVGAAMSAVRLWIYKPTTLNGEVVEVIAPIDVIFSLSQ